MFGFSNTTKIIFTIAVILFACGSFYFSFRGSKFLKSLKSKLTMAVVVVAVVLITTLSLISVRFVERSSIETLANTIKPIAESTAGNFDQTVNRLGESLSESIHNSSGNISFCRKLGCCQRKHKYSCIKNACPSRHFCFSTDNHHKQSHNENQ